MRAAALALLALTLAGCQSTQERSARLERAAKQRPGAGISSARGLSISRPSRVVRVAAATVLRGSEGAAVVLTLRNTGAHALRDVPVEIDVRNAAGATVYTNRAGGLGAALVSAALLPAHGSFTWVDDQVPSSGSPSSVTAKVGEAPTVPALPPTLAVLAARAIEDPSSGQGAEGTVANRSAVEQRELVVYCVARRAGRVLAAGRAVVAQVPARSSARFQIFFVGEARGAALQCSAPATTLG